jgi:hypothetical protein
MSIAAAASMFGQYCTVECACLPAGVLPGWFAWLVLTMMFIHLG